MYPYQNIIILIYTSKTNSLTFQRAYTRGNNRINNAIFVDNNRNHLSDIAIGLDYLHSQKNDSEQ